MVACREAGATVKFVNKKYVRSYTAPLLTQQAASLMDRRDARLVRRKPNQAAVVLAERIIIANAVGDA